MIACIRPYGKVTFYHPMNYSLPYKSHIGTVSGIFRCRTRACMPYSLCCRARCSRPDTRGGSTSPRPCHESDARNSQRKKFSRRRWGRLEHKRERRESMNDKRELSGRARMMVGRKSYIECGKRRELEKGMRVTENACKNERDNHESE